MVQLYSTDLLASIVRPVKELKAFAKVHLEPGERKCVSYTLSGELFSFIGFEMTRVVEPGFLEIAVGASSEDLRLCCTVEITGERRVLGRSWQSMPTVIIEALS